jgi:alpha-mannosidase
MNKITLTFLLAAINLWFSASAHSQGFNNSELITKLASETDGYSEGFVKSISGTDFNYPGLRNDLSGSLLTRCTDGSMAIEWQTAAVSSDFKGAGAGFVWIAAMDLTKEEHAFDVCINGEKKFLITSGEKENLELSSKDGGKLRFITAEKDQNGDAHGYFALWAPAAWLTSGKPLNIKITGNADKSNTWIIVYKATDALNYLQQSGKYDIKADIEIRNEKTSSRIKISLPPEAAGKTIKLSVGKKNYILPVTIIGDHGIASLVLTSMIPDNSIISLSDKSGEIISVNSLKQAGLSTKLVRKTLLQTTVISNRNIINISGIRTYKPNTVSSLVNLSESPLSNGQIYLMNSSHQDIAWMDSPEKCVIERDTMLLTPLIRQALIDPTYRFDVEDALMLKEYIHRHPDRKDDIRELLKSGRISCGSSYTQPYEELHSGEALARQFYFGMKWLKKEFGYNSNTYWNMDVPGKTLQMAQILKKSGTIYMAISRMDKGISDWYSPDGSFVTTYSPGHYSTDFTPLQKNFYEAAEYVASSTAEWGKYYVNNTTGKVTPMFSDWDMSPAKDYSNLISQWNNISQIQAEGGKFKPVHLPAIRLSLTPDFIRDFRQNVSAVPVIKGERPAVWIYIHGPTHEKAITASREADLLLTAAEKFATVNALIDNSFTHYPIQQLNEAWEAKIYPDHGWGGKHGDITDALFQEKYYFARQTAERVLSDAQKNIASRIKKTTGKGLAIVVFNSLSWNRTDVVNTTVTLEKSFAKFIRVDDKNGKQIPVQQESVSYFDDGSIKEINLCFIAGNVPSIGYKTYYLNPADKPTGATEQTNNKSFENQYYKVQLTNGGIASLFDKQLNTEILETGKFKGGEVFTAHSEGTGAGEFADIQKTDMQGLDKASNYKSSWKISSQGEVYTEFLNRQPIRNAVIEQKIRIFSTIKRIDIDIALVNYEGVLYREYRMALPLKMKEGQVSYEVPFGVLNVGKDEMAGAAGERYKTPCKEIHPRGIGNWIGANNADIGVTMSSSVAVADYIDPTDNPASETILQPVLISSRRSCHGEGNEYLQTGDHSFSFSLTSHKPVAENRFRSGMEANEKLRAVFQPEPYAEASLPEELSFFSVDQDNLIISTVKKSEDEDASVIRVYNISGRESEAVIKGFKNFSQAAKLNLIEEPVGPIPVQDGSILQKIGKFAIETYSVR